MVTVNIYAHYCETHYSFHLYYDDGILICVYFRTLGDLGETNMNNEHQVLGKDEETDRISNLLSAARDSGLSVWGSCFGILAVSAVVCVWGGAARGHSNKKKAHGYRVPPPLS